MYYVWNVCDTYNSATVSHITVRLHPLTHILVSQATSTLIPDICKLLAAKLCVCEFYKFVLWMSNSLPSNTIRNITIATSNLDLVSSGVRQNFQIPSANFPLTASVMSKVS